jgi:UDP-GlcNAc:undecaprenyl-phosphate GlcNAc-1-phosphate transferase
MKAVYFLSFALAFFVSFAATLVVMRLAKRGHIEDLPDTERRFHRQPTPTLGGLAVYIAFLLVVLVVGVWGGFLLGGNIPTPLLVGILLGGAILMVGGFLDDRYRLAAKYSVLFPILASLTLVFSGVSAVSVHNPLTNEIILLSPIFSGLIVFLWTMTLTYTTKILDGMDGLVTGVSAIGALVLFGLSLSEQVRQPQTALLAIIFAGGLLGFLILNFHPAKIFLGEGGSTLAGFMLAVLAVVSGGKIATALLIMGVPLLDMVWVVAQRILSGQSPFSGDRRHLHYRLTDLGLSEPQAVLFLYALTGIFGASALFLQSRGKLIALLVMLAVTLAILASLYTIYSQKTKRHKDD